MEFGTIRKLRTVGAALAITAALFGCRQQEQSLHDWMHEHSQGCPQCQPRIDPDCPTVVKELNRRSASDNQ